jgi:pimeloyl-ACP methyl ester carboxylesterase
MKIVTIHGAFSSKNAFNYIISKFPDHDWHETDYSGKISGIKDIIQDIDAQIKQPSLLIGHSMGGIIASNLLTNENVSGIITIAAPLNGLNYPYLLPWLYSKKSFINEIGPASSSILNTKKNIETSKKPVYNIITSNGFNPFMTEDNDGVVSVMSQISPSFTYKLPSPATHTEVLLHEDTVTTLKRIFEDFKK